MEVNGIWYFAPALDEKGSFNNVNSNKAVIEAPRGKPRGIFDPNNIPIVLANPAAKESLKWHSLGHRQGYTTPRCYWSNEAY